MGRSNSELGGFIMPTSLTGNKISQTYPQIIHVDGGVTGTAKALYDGDGTATVLKVSTSEVEISGNLTIAGTLTNVNTTNLQVDDSLIQLGRDNNSSDVVDIGFVGLYDAGGTDKYAGLFRDANDSGKFKLFIDSQEDLSTTNTINTSATGYTVATLVANLEAATVNIDGGNIDGTTISTSDITVGTGKTLNVSGGTLTLANDQISGDAINGGTIGSITISQLAGSLDANNQAITNVNIDSGAIDGTNITVGSSKTLDVSAGTLTLADNQISGDKVEGGTIASITITSVDINGGTIDGVAGAFTTLSASGDVNFDSGTLFVDASENRVGIGTNAPQQPMHIHQASSGSTSYLQLTQDGTGATSSDGLLVGVNAAEAAIVYNAEDTPLIFYTNKVERIRIDNSGHVGVGVDPAKVFHVETSVAGDFISRIKNTDATNGEGLQIHADNTSASHRALDVRNSGGQIFGVYNDGKVGIGTSPPAHLLDIKNSSGGASARIQAGTNSSASLRLQNDAQDWDVNCQTTDNFAIYDQTGSASALTIAPSSYNATFSGQLTVDTGGTSIITADGNNTSGDDGRLILKGHTSAHSRAYVKFNNGVSSGGKDWFLGQIRGSNSFVLSDQDDFTAGGNAIVVDSSKNVTVNASLIAGSGVAIGGTGSANTLDDYEEGTWTPSLSYQNPSGVSLSYDFQVGLYTKIGNIVHVRFSFRVDISGSPVNDNILIAGLPFTSQNATNSEGSNIASDLNITGKANYVASTSVNNTVASIVTSAIEGNQGDDIGVGSNIQFHGGITYIAA